MDKGVMGPQLRVPMLVVVACAAVGGGMISPGCAAEFDTTPVPIAQGSLGEEVVQVFCERMAREDDPSDVSGARWKPVCEGREAPPLDAPPRLVALMANRARLVEALDRTLPPEMGDELGSFLGELMPFFDRPEERLPTQTRRLADFLDQLAADPEAIAALERIGTRQGYRPLRLALGVTRPVLSYPRFDDFTDLALETILEGAAAEELRDLQRAAAVEMATMEPTVDDGRATTLSLMRELMFTQDDLFATGSTSHVLLRDDRGLALPAFDAGGELGAPFVDADLDGRADIDELGRFTTRTGDVLEVPTPFPILGEAGIPRDPSGRAIRADGTRYFQYIDASRTMLAGTTAELSAWFDPAAPTMMQVARGLPVLMGPPIDTSKAYGSYTLSYRAYDTDNGAMFDMVHAVGQLMHRDETSDALLATELLLRDHESEAAGVVRAARYMANQSDLYGTAQLTEDNIFWDDLIDLLVRMSQRPGMLEALMRSFSDPRSAELGDAYGSFMRYRDRVTYRDGAINGAPLGLPLDEAVNRSMPDTFDNESVWQRTLALIDGLNGVTVCNRAGAELNLRVEVLGFGVPLSYPLFGTAGACDIIRIDNVAEAYALAILGEYELELQSGFLTVLTNVADSLGIDVDSALEQASGITGLTRHPTPEALNRLVFWGMSDASGVRSCTVTSDGGNCNSAFAGQLFDPVRDRHGNLVVERYHGTIFAWESPGFYDGMRPMLEVLHRPGFSHDAEGRYFFGELLGTIHRHWGSPANTQTCGVGSCSPGEPNFSYQSNGRSYEALLADGFIDGALMERVHRMNLALEEVEVRPGVDGVAALAAAGEVMIDPRLNDGLTDRRGRATSTFNDGSRTVPMTPLYLLLDALSGIDDAWVAEPDRHTDWLTARRAMGEQFLVTDTLGTGFRLRNRRARAILLTVLPFMRARIDAHRADGDLVAWSTGLDERLADTMREPLMAGLVRLLEAVDRDPDARTALGDLVTYLMSEASDNDAFRSTLYGAADALMVLEDDRNIIPLMSALSDSMAPNVHDVLASGGELDLDASTVRDALDLVRDIQEIDDERTLRTILQNAVAMPETGEEVTPLEVIVDVIAEVNRARPDEGGSLRQEDYRSVIGNVTGFVLDEDHGLERLNGVVQNRSCFPEHGRACATAGSTMSSVGLCYEGATCSCDDMGAGALEWRCARP